MSTESTAQDTDPSCLLTKDEGRVRVLTLNRPRALNAFNQELYLALAKALRDADADPQVRVIVLTGAGDAFTAGQDLTEMAGMSNATGVIGFEVLLDALEALGKPILTAVNGLGLGIGLTILLHTDINFMAHEAKLKCPFVTLGVVPEAGSSFLLPHVLGYQRTAELLFSARYMGAAEAKEVGLVLETLPRAELMARVMTVASAIAVQPPAAVRETKRLMRHATREETRAARERENEEFKRRMVSPEFHEAMLAFQQKRAPNFD